MNHTFELYAAKPIEEDLFNLAVEDLTIDLLEQMVDVGGYFPYVYEFQMSAPNLTFRKRANFLKKLSEVSKTEFLSDDDCLNTYQYIYFRPGHEAVTVVVKSEAVDDREEMIIDYFFSSAWGIFSTEHPLASSQETELIQRFNVVVPELKIVLLDSKMISPSFLNGQKKIEALQKFTHHYLLVPPAESHWFVEEEKVTLAVKILEDFSSEAELPLCVFPVNSSVVENIPGGSDSENYCVVLQQGNTEKIIYKERRKS